MATKDLGRTAIEGGRTGWYKDRVDHHERAFRNETRVSLHRVTANDADEASLPILHPKSKRGNQTDKLRPVWRMLDTYVGRPWAKVFAEICEKFDGRTLAGRHVLHDHIMQSIDPHAYVVRSWYFKNTYYVDPHGIFRKRDREPYPKFPRIERTLADEVQAWLGSRGITSIGKKLFWAVPSEPVFFAFEATHGVTYSEFTRAHKFRFEVIGPKPKKLLWPFVEPWDPQPKERPEQPVSWGRGKALSQADVAFFKSLPKCVQTAIVVQPGTVTLKRAA